MAGNVCADKVYAGNLLAPKSLLHGMTVVSAADGATLLVDGQITCLDYLSDNPGTVVTLPAATVGAKTCLIMAILCAHANDATLTVDCAGTDKFMTGSLLQSRAANDVVYDTSAAGETSFVFTPVNGPDMYNDQGSSWIFTCEIAGEWIIHHFPVANPAGTGLVGSMAFAP